MQKYLYLALDLGSVLVPILFSFYPKKHFASTWRAWLPAIAAPAVLFIVWDEWFTAMRVWGFNSNYLTGISFGHLPLEEILFFLCIPYACLFTYVAVNYLKKEEPLPDRGLRVTWTLIVGLVAVGIKNYDRWYTMVTFFGLAAFLLYLILVIKPNYLGRFYFSYLFILIPFFLVNGVLTGSWIERPVVWYNDEENLGIRMGTIPFEDTFYGMLLILMNVVIYEWRMARLPASSAPPAP
ncbi:MAG: lycopene cyclase domain-containing protein [Cyclobacteriaceae bacterium]|nr:lycopene cyclase domain-containing protein [Cyclobacteriaceae bacterium]